MAKIPTTAPAKKTRDAQASRERLIDTAIELTWKNSYDSVGVNEICKQAEMTKGCFYHHFATKADLFYEASRRHFEEYKISLDAIVSPALNGLEQLQALNEFSAEKQAEHSNNDNPVAGCPFFSIGAQVGHREPLIARAAQEVTDEILPYLVIIIRNLQDQGYAEKIAEPEQLARLMYQYYQGLFLYGRVYQSYDAVKQDQPMGLAILLGLKPEYRPE